MRSLSSTLLAAQRGSARAPYVRAVFTDYWGDRPRLRFSRFYSGSEVEGPIGVVVAGDGSLVRARIDPSNNHLYVSRVTSPGPGSTYSSWTDLGAIVAAGTPLALFYAAGEVDLVYVHTDNVSIKLKYSWDNGATWNDAGTILTAGAKPTAMCGAFRPDGERVLFWNEGGATVYRSRWTSGGGWGARTAWTNTIGGCTGLATEYIGDWAVMVTGTDTPAGDAKVWSCLYGDGVNQGANTWSALTEITTAVSGSGVSYRSPALATWYQSRAWFCEKYTGSLAYSRLHRTELDPLAADFKQDLWLEPVAFAYTGDYGLAAWAVAGGVWLAAAAGVWYAAGPDSGGWDASGDVLEADVTLSPALSHQGEGGVARLVLDNSSGRYSYGGAREAEIGLGRRLSLSFGLKTPAGVETSDGPGYWVTGVSRQHATGNRQQGGPSAGSGRAVVEVEARDGWHLLESWRARRELQWAAGTKSVSQLVGYIAARAGLHVTNASASGAISALKPAFTIDPGESGATAVRRLLEKVPDVARMTSGELQTLYPQASDASAYTYGTDHALAGAEWRETPAAVNRARVVGAGVFGESFDFAGADEGVELVRNVADVGITTTGDATARADFELRRAQLGADGSRVVVPMNVGQELWDVVTVTDGVAGLASAVRRVQGLRFRAGFEARPRFELELVLGAR